MVAHTWNLSTWEYVQEGREFETSLGYTWWAEGLPEGYVETISEISPQISDREQLLRARLCFVLRVKKGPGGGGARL